jgi:hypothetical protein
MPRACLIFVLMAWASGPAAGDVGAQAQAAFESSPDSAGSTGAQVIDGVAARIEDDVITESEVRELSAFQELVDGHSKPRAEVIKELADQWIVRGEASAAKYPRPSKQEVDRAYAQFIGQFPSQEEFKARCAKAGLSDAALHRLIEEQLYLSRFLDYRFRPAAQVDEKQIEAYYRDEFAPSLKSRGEEVPSLDKVEDTIREVLIQRAINERAAKWLDETRERLKIDMVPEGNTP